MIRICANRGETEACSQLIKKGKIFVAPYDDGSTFKALFKKLAAAGAGRRVGADGFPPGPWTPDLLATAISQFDGNKSGIELRTVQLWFQDNDRGISSENIRWLARVFGCDDPAATADWQVVLSAALAAQRREKRRKQHTETSVTAEPEPDVAAEPEPEPESDSAVEPDLAPVPHSAPVHDDHGKVHDQRKFLLARASEALFSSGSPLDLPASVFAGAVALGFVSFIIGVHNVTYDFGGIAKQVGYWWAPNWTVLFLVFLPLFLGFVVETLLFWKREARPMLIARIGSSEAVKPWLHTVEASSFTFWAVFLICSVFAGIIQWVGVRLVPLVSGRNEYATDWGTVALVRPDEVSVLESIGFTALTYIYMSLCFYVLFVGLILLYKLVHDCGKLSDKIKADAGPVAIHQKRRLQVVIMNCIYRCSILVVLIGIAMNLQGLYLASDARNIVTWLLQDINAVLNIRDHDGSYLNVTLPNHFSSLVVILATGFVFIYGMVRFRFYATNKKLFIKMATVSVLLCAAYFLIDWFDGWVILLGAATILSAYAIFDPEFNLGRRKGLRENRSVS